MGSEDTGRQAAETGWRGKVETQVKSTSLLFFILFSFAAFGLFLYLADRQTVYEVSDALIAGFSVGSFMRFAPAGWNAIKLPVHNLHSGDFLVVGINFLCVGGILRFIGQWYWRAMDKPNWWIDSPALAFTTAILGVGYCLVQATTFTDRGVLVRGAGLRTGYVGVVSVAVAACLIWAGWG
jgi:hypothetical protein